MRTNPMVFALCGLTAASVIGCAATPTESASAQAESANTTLPVATANDHWIVYTATFDQLPGKYALRADWTEGAEWFTKANPSPDALNRIWFVNGTGNAQTSTNLLFPEYSTNEASISKLGIDVDHANNEQPPTYRTDTHIPSSVTALAADQFCCDNPGKCSITSLDNIDPTTNKFSIQVISCGKRKDPTGEVVYFQVTNGLGYTNDCYVGVPFPAENQHNHKKEACSSMDVAKWKQIDNVTYRNVEYSNVIVTAADFYFQSARRVPFRQLSPGGPP